MEMILNIVVSNLLKVGFGASLFLTVFIANMALGTWKNVTLEGNKFDYHKIIVSFIRYLILTIGIALVTIVISVVPIYVQYIGFEFPVEAVEVFDSTVIIGSFLVAIIKYTKDAVTKVKELLEH